MTEPEGKEAASQLVLVTGATGFVGRRVVQALVARGKTVRALAHQSGREHLFPGQAANTYL